MLTMTSRDVQTGYGNFVESTQEDTVCVTRHGRPLFYAVPAKKYSAQYLWGQLVLEQGQRDRVTGDGRGNEMKLAMQAVPRHDVLESMSEADVMAFVKANRV